MKHIILTLIMAIMAIGANAQVTPFPLTAAYGDTLVTNSTAAKQTITVIEDGYVMVTATVTKRSGTLAGYVELLGSNDGVNYKRVKGCGLTTTVDTLVLANNTTAQTYSWKVDPNCYWKYRIQVNGSGTMTASLRTWLWRKKKTGCNN